MDYNKIWDLAGQKKINKKTLAHTLGVTPNGLRLMATINTMTVATLEKISEILGVSPAYWWRDEMAIEDGNPTYFVTAPDQKYVNREAFTSLLNSWEKEREFYRSQILFLQNIINQESKSKAV